MSKEATKTNNKTKVLKSCYERFHFEILNSLLTEIIISKYIKVDRNRNLFNVILNQRTILKDKIVIKVGYGVKGRKILSILNILTKNQQLFYLRKILEDECGGDWSQCLIKIIP